jgi:hypothetical protein
VVTAIVRELLGFIWAIGIAAEATNAKRRAADGRTHPGIRTHPEAAAVEEDTERSILDTAMRQASGPDSRC